MQNHSSKLQKWISKSEQEQIEALITRIERQYPFEVVVAMTDSPAAVPMAAARMIALLAIAADLVAEALWLPVPSTVFGFVVFLFLLFPSGRWHGLWLFRLIAGRGERQRAVNAQAEQCFSDLGLARTRERNALLMFFNLKERIFCLKPDRSLDKEWPELKLEELVSELEAHLEKSQHPASAASHSIERLLALAQNRWPDLPEKHTTPDELPNALSWWAAK